MKFISTAISILFSIINMAIRKMFSLLYQTGFYQQMDLLLILPIISVVLKQNMLWSLVCKTNLT
jgi:hypothetical protein